MPLELRGATEGREGRVLTNALLRGETPPAAAQDTAEGAAEGAAEPVAAELVAAAEAAAAPAAAGAAASATDLYGAERAALAASMAALQRQAMPGEAWELVRARLRAHRHRLGVQAPASGGATHREKGEL